MATFAYERINIKKQAQENQRGEIERAGFRVAHWYADQGIGSRATAAQRPQFSRMLDQMRDGDTLVVSKLDRLGCDAQDVGAIIDTLAARRIAVFVLQLGKHDLTSPAAKPMLAMLNAVAEIERDDGARHTQSEPPPAKTQTKPLGRPSKTTPEQRAAIITEYSTGTSVSELARRYKVSRANILGIVTPKTRQEEPLPTAWGD